MGLVPKQTKADFKIFWGLTLSRVLGILATIVISQMFSAGIHRYLKIPFMIFCIILYLISNKKAPTNPKKTYWRGCVDFYLYLFKRKKYNHILCAEYGFALEKEEKRNESKASNKKGKRDKTKRAKDSSA